ncbi:hypothetical protein [Sphingobacterium mizutaii]|uniref:hypothetical protein n=1 Tax=Sphingobacterium mizutaii TaxID=1010 RepID=UPI003D988163
MDKEDILELSLNEQYEDFIELLMRCYIEGKHFIAMSPRTLNLIIKSTNKTNLINKLNAYKSDYNTSSLSFLKLASHVCQIKPGNGYNSIIDDGITFLQIGIDHFLDSSAFQKTILLCENINDCDFFEIIGKNYLRINGINTSMLKFNPQGGGGSTIQKEYSKIYSSHENFCLCIVDSDIKYPGGKEGSTSSNLFKFIKKNNENLKIFAEVLSVHEIENLIPRKFYIKNYEDKGRTWKGNYYLIDKLFYKNSINQKHFDFKQGLKRLSLVNQEVDHQKLTPNTYNQQSKEIYWIKEILANSIPLKEDNYYVYGYGEKILEDFIKYENLEEIVEEIKYDLVYNNWLIIGRIIYSFCLGNSKKFAV